jgi:hypothetical protein
MPSELMEQLAAIEHERWSDWMRYLLGQKCVYNPADGSSTIPGDYLAALWVLINTPYDRLSDDQKENDRREVRRYIHLIAMDPTTEPSSVTIPVPYLQILYANATHFQRLGDDERPAFDWALAALEAQPDRERWPE